MEIEKILNSSLEHIRDLADANTVIGTPIVVGKTTVIPVTKVCMGTVSGGSDIPTKTPVNAMYPFGGTNALGMSLSPVAFISATDSGIVVTPVEYKNPVDKLIDIAMPLADKIMQKLNCKCEGKQ